jgi:hypothetical protein
MTARRASAGALAVMILAAAGCGTEVQTLSFPVPPPTAPTPPTTTGVGLPDGSTVSLPGVPGAAPATPVEMGPGQATVAGSVLGATGPVPGATVEITRLVGAQSTSTEVLSSRTGAFTLSGVLGGRFRVRAWKTPDLDMTTPEIFYLANGGTQRLELRPSSYRGPTVTSSFAPDPATAGAPTTVLVQLTDPTVSADGDVVYAPAVDDPVRIVGGTGWAVSGPARGRTDADGEVSFVVACGAVGDDPLTAVVERTVAVSLHVPACIAVPPTPTTTLPPPTTTTTLPHRHHAPPTTTTTTRHHRR